jgi:RNA polymerase sigma-70 factor (ECF subfamily)
MANECYAGNLGAEFTRMTPPASMQDDSLAFVRACQHGQRDAFGQLYQRYAPMVHGILLARVPRQEVDDLVHEVFLRALSRLQSLRDASRFGPWLAAITRNMANDYHRDSRTHSDQNEHTVAADEISAPDHPSEKREAQEILEIIRALPEAYRETLVLRLVEGMTGPEIAAKTGLAHGSVRVNLHRGMLQLREKLDAHRAPSKSSKHQNATIGEQR